MIESKGIAKTKYDKEHKDSLEKYAEIRERMQILLEQGEKIPPNSGKRRYGHCKPGMTVSERSSQRQLQN